MANKFADAPQEEKKKSNSLALTPVPLQKFGGELLIAAEAKELKKNPDAAIGKYKEFVREAISKFDGSPKTKNDLIALLDGIQSHIWKAFEYNPTEFLFESFSSNAKRPPLDCDTSVALMCDILKGLGIEAGIVCVPQHAVMMCKVPNGGGELYFETTSEGSQEMSLNYADGKTIRPTNLLFYESRKIMEYIYPTAGKSEIPSHESFWFNCIMATHLIGSGNLPRASYYTDRAIKADAKNGYFVQGVIYSVFYGKTNDKRYLDLAGKSFLSAVNAGKKDYETYKMLEGIHAELGDGKLSKYYCEKKNEYINTLHISSSRMSDPIGNRISINLFNDLYAGGEDTASTHAKQLPTVNNLLETFLPVSPLYNPDSRMYGSDSMRADAIPDVRLPKKGFYQPGRETQYQKDSNGDIILTLQDEAVAEILEYRANLYAQMGEYKRAAEDIGRRMNFTLASNFNAMNVGLPFDMRFASDIRRKGIYNYKAGEYEQAIRDLEAGIKLNEGQVKRGGGEQLILRNEDGSPRAVMNPEPYFYIGCSYARLGKLAEAKKWLAEAKGFSEAEYGRLLEEAGDPLNGFKKFKKD